jgi:hypothetical protein
MPAVEELMEVQHVRITSTDLASVSPKKNIDLKWWMTKVPHLKTETC